MQGLAHCFEKNDDGKLADRFVIEPITANSLECMANGELGDVLLSRPEFWQCPIQFFSACVQELKHASSMYLA